VEEVKKVNERGKEMRKESKKKDNEKPLSSRTLMHL
jgi:hypothetical protein